MNTPKFTPGPLEAAAGLTALVNRVAENYEYGDIISGADIDLARRIARSPNGPIQRLVESHTEMYEALKACHLQMLQSNNRSEYAEEANQLAIAALAKAEGVQP